MITYEKLLTSDEEDLTLEEQHLIYVATSLSTLH